MTGLTLTMTSWFVLLLAAVYCVPLLEQNDIRSHVNSRNPNFDEFYEQGNAQNVDKMDRADQGTNFEDGQMNKNELLAELMDVVSSHKTKARHLKQNTKENDKFLINDGDHLMRFRDTLDKILEIIDPLDNVIRKTEERFETESDYDSVLYELIESFIGRDSFGKQGSSEKEHGISLHNHDRTQNSDLIHNKLAEDYARKFLEDSDVNGIDNEKWQTVLRALERSLKNLKKRRAKRLSYDDGFVKELPIMNFDLDRAFYSSNDQLPDTDLKAIYEKKGAECTMVHGYKRSPIMSVARCPWNTVESNVKTLCEDVYPVPKQHMEDNEINLLHTPVQDLNGFVYKNLYCAQCNGVKHPVAWSTALNCEDMLPLELTDGRDKVLIMGEYSKKKLGCKRTMRPVLLRMIHECDDSEVRQQVGLRRHQTRTGSGGSDDYSPFPLSFSIFMNFGFDGKTHILFTTSPDEQFVTQVCPKGQMYDPVNNKCRNISCEQGYKLVENTCVRAATYESDTTTGDIASLKDIEETVQVVLTLKNVSYGEIVLLTISSVEETLAFDLAQQFNISTDRITNLTVSVVNASSYGNTTENEVIEIHRFTTPQPANIFHRKMKVFTKPHTTKGILNTANNTQPPAIKVYTGARKNQDTFDESNPEANVNISMTLSKGHTRVTHPSYATPLSSGKPFPSKETSQSEEPNFNDIWGEFPKVNVRISFLLKPAHENRTLTEKSVKSVVQKMSDLISSNSFSITINGTNFKVEELENPSTITSMDLFCRKGENAYISDEDFEVIRRYDADRNENLTLVKVNETGQEFRPGEYDLTLTVHGTVGNLSRAKVDSFVFVCNMPKITNAECSRIVLTKSEYKMFSNKSVEFAGQQYNLSQYEYDNIDEDTIKICTPDWSNVRTVYDKTEWGLVCGEDLRKLAIAESWLTFGLGLISLVFMLSVLATYFLFEKLRNLPGVNTLNLTISLFLGELVFIASGYAKPHEEWLCSGVGMILHYLYLASFFWMNVMSYDVYRTFAKKCILTRIRNKKKYTPRYAVYAWGSPLLIVVVCAILNYSDIPEVRIGYGGYSYSDAPAEGSHTVAENGTSSAATGNSNHVHNIGCWIQEPVATMAAFGGPMILILLSNAVMFTRTIICIRASTKMTQMRVRRSSLSHMAGHDDVMLYIRMSTVMGFTWIFGLASSLVSTFAEPPSRTICIVLHLLQILFIIFNCSQGIFIFFAFVCNRRVLTLYRGIIYKVRNRGVRERPLSSCSSRSTLGTSLSQTSLSHIT